MTRVKEKKIDTGKEGERTESDKGLTSHSNKVLG